MSSGIATWFGFGSPTKAEDPVKESPNEASPGSTCAGASPQDVPSNGLPEYDYPGLPLPDLTIKNTFIDAPPADALASTAEFMKPREVQSCPNSAIGAPPGLLESKGSSDEAAQKLEAALAEHEASGKDKAEASSSKVDDATPLASSAAVSIPTLWPQTGEGLEELVENLVPAANALTPERSASSSQAQAADSSATPVRPTTWPRTMSGDNWDSILGVSTPQPASSGGYTAVSTPSPMRPAAPAEAPPNFGEFQVPPPPGSTAFGASAGPPNWHAELPAAPVLRLSEAIPEPVVGTLECPTEGSKGHRLNNCKPCAFLFTKGCTNGAKCQFCHLCESGEKKKRQREKRQLQRMGLVPVGSK